MVVVGALVVMNGALVVAVDTVVIVVVMVVIVVVVVVGAFEHSTFMEWDFQLLEVSTKYHTAGSVGHASLFPMA